MIESKMFDCKLIDRPKKRPDHKRTFSVEFATRLADSIRTDGLLHPIMIRPNPEKPGRFLIVQGEHRWYAVAKVIKEPSIEAKLDAEMSERKSEAASLAENVWRNPLSKAQQLLSVKSWFEIYQERNPQKVRGSETARELRAEQAKAKAVGAAGEATAQEGTATQAEESKPENTTGNFAQTVAAATGRSVSTAKRVAGLARKFTADQLQAFDQMRTSQSDMEEIAKVSDEDKRSHIVNLVVSGMEAAQAIKEILGDKAPAPKPKRKRKAKATSEPEPKTTEPEEDDATWFTRECGEFAKLLADPTKYKVDAVLFRQASQARQAFRGATKSLLEQAKKAIPDGHSLLFNMIKRVTSVAHPREWFLCEKCKGQGKILPPDEGPAEWRAKCDHGGYLVRTEKYL